MNLKSRNKAVTCEGTDLWLQALPSGPHAIHTVTRGAPGQLGASVPRRDLESQGRPRRVAAPDVTGKGFGWGAHKCQSGQNFPCFIKLKEKEQHTSPDQAGGPGPRAQRARAEGSAPVSVLEGTPSTSESEPEALEIQDLTLGSIHPSWLSISKMATENGLSEPLDSQME